MKGNGWSRVIQKYVRFIRFFPSAQAGAQIGHLHSHHPRYVKKSQSRKRNTFFPWMEIKLLNGQNFSKLKARTMILMILEGFHQQEVFCEYIVNDVFERTFLLWFNWTFRKRPDLFASLPEVGVWRWGRNGSLCMHIMVPMVSLVGSIPVTRVPKNDSFAKQFVYTVHLMCPERTLSSGSWAQAMLPAMPISSSLSLDTVGRLAKIIFLLQWPVCFLILAIQVGV